MKLIVQSDDYGITRGVSQGILSGIRYGIIRNTGIFTNMPWTEECAEWIRPELDRIALGIDLNASTGSSVLGHSVLPSLTHEDGSFLTSRENRALDTQENGFDHVSYDEVYLEFEAHSSEIFAWAGVSGYCSVYSSLPSFTGESETGALLSSSMAAPKEMQRRQYHPRLPL
jgi:predicted glycoside hydrolase/deacetylase ChbG (UPF0249 family)